VEESKKIDCGLQAAIRGWKPIIEAASPSDPLTSWSTKFRLTGTPRD
jgi:hypothetical protein